MPKVKNLGLTGYLKKEDRARKKMLRQEMLAQKKESKRQHKVSSLIHKAELSKAKTKLNIQRKKERRSGSMLGLHIKKKRQSSHLSRKSRIRLI